MVGPWVCAVDGVEVVRTRAGTWIHTDGFDSSVPEHAAQPVTAEERFRRTAEREKKPSPAERSAIALERIAAALEALVSRG